MNFVPTGKAYNKAQLKYDLKQFFSKNKGKKIQRTSKWTQKKKKSTWTPKENHYSIETFIKSVNKHIELVVTGKQKKAT